MHEYASSDSSASPRDFSLLVSGTAPIVTIPTSPTTDQDISDEALYSPAGSMNRATRDLEQLWYPGHIGDLGYPGHTSPTTNQLVQPRSRIYSPAGSINRATGDLEQLECSYRGELDYPASTSEAALYSSEEPIQGPDLAGDPEQLEYRYRLMTLGEEEVMRIYEDGIYRPPDMTEKPRGVQIKEFGVRPGRRCSLQNRVLLLCTPPVPSPTPESPLSPGAARILVEAANESEENMEAVVDRFKAVVDIFSSDSSDPRTPSPAIELEDLLEFEEAAQRHPDPVHLNKIILRQETLLVIDSFSQIFCRNS